MTDGAEEHKHQTSGDGLEPENFRKIFVGGLTANTTDDTLKEFYQQFGEITDIIVMRDPNTKRSRGFGFVTFNSKSMVDAAMKGRPHEIDGKTVDPKRAVPRDDKNRNESNVSTKRLYVSGVREDHTEEMFSEYFSKFGEVVKSEIILDKTTNKPRGFGFVTFNDHDSVDQCVLIKSHMINDFRCDVRKGLSKEEMNKASQQSRDRDGRFGRSRDFGTSGGGGGRGGYNGGGYGGGAPRGGYGGGGGYGGYGQPAQQSSWGDQGGWGGQQGGWGQQPPPQQAWGQQPPQQPAWGQVPPQQQGGWGQQPPQQQGGWGQQQQGGQPWGGAPGRY